MICLPYNIACISIDGRIAQLGEHLPYKQGVIGSSPIATTILQVTNKTAW